jgi:hypothetical protein
MLGLYVFYCPMGTVEASIGRGYFVFRVGGFWEKMNF